MAEALFAKQQPHTALVQCCPGWLHSPMPYDVFCAGSVTALTPTTLKEASLATDAAWMVRRRPADCMRTVQPGKHPANHTFGTLYSVPPQPFQVFFYTQSHGTSVAAAPVFLQVADE